MLVHFALINIIIFTISKYEFMFIYISVYINLLLLTICLFREDFETGTQNILFLISIISITLFIVISYSYLAISQLLLLFIAVPSETKKYMIFKLAIILCHIVAAGVLLFSTSTFYILMCLIAIFYFAAQFVQFWIKWKNQPDQEIMCLSRIYQILFYISMVSLMIRHEFT
jgi:hypothetical protein